MKKVPAWLQPILWSVKVNHLNLKKDQAYIINQILVYGGLKELKWLFKTYPLTTLKNVFVKRPTKVYTKSSFNFAKEILLGLGDLKLDPFRYDRDLPRVIRR